MNSDQGIETNSAKFDINQWLSEHSVRIVGSSEEPFYYASDVAKVIGIKRVDLSIRDFAEDEMVSSEQRKKHNIITYKKYKDTMRKDHSVLLLTLQGVYRLIAQSRAPVAEELRKKSRDEINRHRLIPEPNFINKIQAIFSTEVFERQKPVLNYYVDLYMPDYNLAIEFDERHHEYRQEQDRRREEHIIKELKCKFIRVKITDDIFAAAGKIYAFIRAH